MLLRGSIPALFASLRSDDGTKPKLGNSLTVNVNGFQSQWHFHPDPNVDIAVMAFAPLLRQFDMAGSKIFYRSLDTSILPTEEQMRELNAIEDVIFVGYPKGIFDTKNLLPIARRGITATPIQVDYNGLPVFLIDASVFPGSSGSPVLIANEGGFASRQGFTVGSRAWLLGVVARVHLSQEKGHIVIEDRPVGDVGESPAVHVPIPVTQQYLNLGLVFKAHTVIETIEDLLRLRQPSLLEAEDVQKDSDPLSIPDESEGGRV